MAVKFDKVLQKLRESDEGNVSVSWGDIGGTLSSQTDLNTALSGKLSAASNLSDVADVSDARTNLGLGTAAEVNTGTTDGTIPVLDVTNKFDIAVIPDIPFANLSGLPGDNTALQTALDDKADVSSLGTLSTQNGTFSGGGTLATGGYTLTVPATGTAALLGTANTFTATQIVVVDQANAEFQAFTYRDTPSAGFFRANKARGTLASPTVLQDGDLIGGFIGNGYTGAVFLASAQISLVADGAMGSNRIPGRIELLTSDGTAGATARMTIKNNGNVGIGTTAPGAKLDVASTSGGGNSALRLTQLAENAFASLSYLPIDFYVPTTGLVGQILSTANNYVPGTFTSLSANSTAVVNTTTSGHLLLGAGGASGYVNFITGGYASANERMRITKEGNVGIGTTGPVSKLHISYGTSGETRVGQFDGTTAKTWNGATNIESIRLKSTFTGESSPSDNARLTWGFANTYVNNGARFGIDVLNSTGNFANVITATGNGNVGIGTTAPGATLDVQRNVANANPTLRVYNQNAGGGSGLNISGGNNTYNSLLWTNGVSGDLSFQTQTAVYNASNIRMIIQNSGNVGIGTTAPDKAVEINSATGANLRLTYNDSNGSAVNYVDFATTSSGDLTITPSGGDVDIVGNLKLSAKNLITDTTTGMKIGTATSQKIGLWNATPIVQPTTSVAAATFVAGAGTAVNDASTFDGYTLKQVVKALRNIGLLA